MGAKNAVLKEMVPLNSEVAGELAEELLRVASGIDWEEEYVDSFDSLGYHPGMRRHMLHGYRGSVSYGYGYGYGRRKNGHGYYGD